MNGYVIEAYPLNVSILDQIFIAVNIEHEEVVDSGNNQSVTEKATTLSSNTDTSSKIGEVEVKKQLPRKLKQRQQMSVGALARKR